MADLTSTQQSDSSDRPNGAHRMTGQLISEHPVDGVTVLRLNRPQALNALDRALVRQLHDAVDAVGRDRACKVVIIAGEGRGFCAGLDLHEAHSPIPGTEDESPAMQQMLLQKTFTDLN